MTMKREAKKNHQEHLTGGKVAKSGYSGKPLTVDEYKTKKMLKGRTQDAITATAKKMDRMGYVPTDRGGFKKTTRKFG